MYFKLIFFVFSTLFVFNSYASVVLHVPKNYEHPNQCYAENERIFVEVGKAYRLPGICEEKKCIDTGKEYYLLTHEGCDRFHIDPPCKFDDGDNSLPFPKCCPKPVCPFLDQDGKPKNES